ncbi:MAG: Gfo/Idh/MocA family oxidoreductase [Pirellula sp.]
MTYSNTNRRRTFLKTFIAAAGSVAMGKSSMGYSANDKLNLAFVGVGGRGESNRKELIKEGAVNVVAICDVNGNHLDRVGQEHSEARRYVDFRRMLDDLKDVDAVVVSSTEHTHAFATAPALLQRKPVYCEKPLTYNIQEARRIMQLAAEAKVPTQMGTQIHGMPNYRRVVELVQSGAIGAVTEAHVWVSRAWGLQSQDDATKNKDIVFVTDRPTEVVEIPKGLDWDLWVGPAPTRPYHNVYFPGPKWYRWWDFGNGTMSDLGSHWNDLPFWALKLDAPKSVEAFGDKPHAEIAPATMTAVYEYGPRGNMPPCKLVWYQGADKPKIWKEGGIPQWGNGVLFVGDQGMILSDYNKHLLLPEDKFVDFKRPDPFIPDSPGQHREWLNAIRNGTPTGSPFSYAGLLTEANHLGNVAFRAGKKLLWDFPTMKATNCPEADKFISRTPRAGWSLG